MSKAEDKTATTTFSSSVMFSSLFCRSYKYAHDKNELIKTIYFSKIIRFCNKVHELPKQMNKKSMHPIEAKKIRLAQLTGKGAAILQTDNEWAITLL